MQWLFLMCGIRLNEVIVQVDPYTDAEWKVRKAELDGKRAEAKQRAQIWATAGEVDEIEETGDTTGGRGDSEWPN